jgi:hypothetical protein
LEIDIWKPVIIPRLTCSPILLIVSPYSWQKTMPIRANVASASNGYDIISIFALNILSNGAISQQRSNESKARSIDWLSE